MMKSSAATVADYLASLPQERRATVERVRDVVLARLPAGYEEAMSWGVISYEIPLSRYPDTYNARPLMFAGLSAQKNYFALYLMCITEGPLGERLRAAFASEGKKLDKGKGCIRFAKAEDLPLAAIGDLIAEVTPDVYISKYEAARADYAAKKAAGLGGPAKKHANPVKKAAKKAATKAAKKNASAKSAGTDKKSISSKTPKKSSNNKRKR